MRFPQPVRVGDLLGREVLVPSRANTFSVGFVDLFATAMVRSWLWWTAAVFWASTWPIAVSVDAMVLLGQDMEIVAFTPKQLRQFPTFSPSRTTDVADDAIIKVGLAKPSH